MIINFYGSEKKLLETTVVAERTVESVKASIEKLLYLVDPRFGVVDGKDGNENQSILNVTFEIPEGPANDMMRRFIPLFFADLGLPLPEEFVVAETLNVGLADTGVYVELIDTRAVRLITPIGPMVIPKDINQFTLNGILTGLENIRDYTLNNRATDQQHATLSQDTIPDTPSGEPITIQRNGAVVHETPTSIIDDNDYIEEQNAPVTQGDVGLSLLIRDVNNREGAFKIARVEGTFNPRILKEMGILQLIAEALSNNMKSRIVRAKNPETPNYIKIERTLEKTQDKIAFAINKVLKDMGYTNFEVSAHMGKGVSDLMRNTNFIYL